MAFLKFFARDVSSIVVGGCVSVFMVNCASKPPEAKLAAGQIKVQKTTNYSFRFDTPATVNGVARLFHLDTGASNSSIESDEQTGAFKATGERSFASATGVEVKCDTISVNSFEFADLDRRKFSFLRCPGSAIINPNTLGVDALDRKAWALRFSKFQLSKLVQIPKSEFILPILRGPQRQILLPITIAGFTEHAVFDTGANLTSIDSDFVDAHPEAFKQLNEDASVIKDGANQNLSVHYFKVADLMVGPLHYKNQIVTSFKFPKAMKKAIGARMIIGSNTMVQTDWLMDLKKNNWTARQWLP